MLYLHYSLIAWDKRRYPNFSPNEPHIACRCCGEFYMDYVAFDMLQKLRSVIGKPMYINSGHRCYKHNALVGGAPMSMHKKIAFDISLKNQNPGHLIKKAREVGFSGFGFYETFLHVDTGRNRIWVSDKGRKTWTGLI